MMASGAKINWPEENPSAVNNFAGFKGNLPLGTKTTWHRLPDKELPLEWNDMRLIQLIFDELDAKVELGYMDIKKYTIGYYKEALKTFIERYNGRK